MLGKKTSWKKTRDRPRASEKRRRKRLSKKMKNAEEEKLTKRNKNYEHSRREVVSLEY